VVLRALVGRSAFCPRRCVRSSDGGLAVNVDELVNRFDDLVAAVEQIADVMEQLANDVPAQGDSDSDDQGNDRQPAE
jgi:hypothetical protein